MTMWNEILKILKPNKNKYMKNKVSTINTIFECISVIDNSKEKNKSVYLLPVDDEKNQSFSKLSLSGDIQLGVDYNTPAYNLFKVGKLYNIDITEI